MAIEFFCSQCNQRLQVPDDSEGKQAKCPGCGAVVTVPETVGRHPAPPPELADTLPPQSAPTLDNPYAAPTSVPETDPGGTGAMVPATLDAGNALTEAWRWFKVYAVVLIVAYLIQMAFSFGISFGGTFLQVMAEQLLGGPQSPAVLALQAGTSLLNQLIQMFLTIGLIRMCLAAARNQPVEVGMLFSGGPYLLRYIGASILFMIALTIGFALLIVPGIYLALTYWSFLYFLVDRNAGVLESFRLAGQYATNNRLHVFLLGLMSIGLMLLGFLACGVGILVAGPLVMLMFTVAYLMITGQYYGRGYV